MGLQSRNVKWNPFKVNFISTTQLIKQPFRHAPWYSCRYKLIKMQARSKFFCIFAFSFSFIYFLEQLLMASKHWDKKYFTLDYQNYLFSFFFFLLYVDYFWFTLFSILFISHMSKLFSRHKCFKNVSACLKMIWRWGSYYLF